MQGKTEVEQLLLDAVKALKRAELHETMRLVHERLLSRPPEELLDTRPGSRGGWECQLKPMVELLFRDILWLAVRVDRSTDARHAEIACMMELAGF